jgi:hypothetical protein
MKLFTTALFVLTFFVVVNNTANAQTITLSATESATPATESASIHYDFPYPGILPNHPLYMIKVARDHFVGFLINDPIKKAEFNLLQSDKKMFAAQLLFGDDSDQLGVDTLSKSNNYMHHAISDAIKAQGVKPTASQDVIGKIALSITKHEEAIKILLKEDTEQKKSLQGELNRLETIEKYYFESFPKK